MKPILFNTAMVRAILDGRKTVTRRVVKMDKADAVLSSQARMENPDIPDDRFIKCLCTAPCEIGDILYVRETWAFDIDDDDDEIGTGCFFYRADNLHHPNCKWRPSIHMPKEAARLFLLVTAVRVERLQDITPEQIDAEGFKEFGYSAKTGELLPSSPSFFRIGWDKTIKSADLPLYGWDANPWVWVIEFERISKEVALEGDGDDK